MADLSKIVDELSTLTVLEAAELAKMLEEKWGVSAAAAVAVAPFFVLAVDRWGRPSYIRHVKSHKRTVQNSSYPR